MLPPNCPDGLDCPYFFQCTDDTTGYIECPLASDPDLLDFEFDYIDNLSKEDIDNVY